MLRKALATLEKSDPSENRIVQHLYTGPALRKKTKLIFVDKTSNCKSSHVLKVPIKTDTLQTSNSDSNSLPWIRRGFSSWILRPWYLKLIWIPDIIIIQNSHTPELYREGFFANAFSFHQSPMTRPNTGKQIAKRHDVTTKRNQ